MLGALIAYLRTALPRLRESSSSIGREIDLVRAYVDVMRVSAGSAIALDIDMAQSVRDARMPAMLLLPLVNLAVRRRCDAIRIRARQDAGKLRVSVSQGASAVADEDRQELADIRARLRALYNEEARLTFVDEHGARVCAMVEIPHEPADGGHR
jgi:LytS/YehU family sensor histidine kinase